MLLKISGLKRPLKTAVFLSLVLLLGISIGYLTNHVLSENAKFEAFAEDLFEKEVSGNALTLHYSLAYPEKQGINRCAPSLGIVTADMENSAEQCREYETALKDFSYSRLSRDNQITLDMLLLYYHTQSSLDGLSLLEEPLGPSLGIQAQLPVLLAEYSFYEDRDISDYLNLLTSIRPYFQSILAFEKEKSEAGLFMSDTTLDRILKQCSAFIKDPESNYMLEIFSQKLEEYGKFPDKELAELNAKHKEIFLNEVIPAYQELMSGLSALRGTGKSSRGLARFDGGREYYLYLLKSQVGTYVPVPQMEKRLLGQLMTDSKEASGLLKKNPSLISKLTDESLFSFKEPAQILETLKEQIAEDFPKLDETPCEIRYVHESMEDFLSPAFYLTPPLDTGTPNVIYINRSGGTSPLELFTTLAHEGYPGHLYQTVFFGRQNPENIRYLITSSGYVEGWATYTESYAYGYAGELSGAEDGPEAARLSWLNRSINLCIYSLLDIGIHYRGWDEAQAAGFLKAFGIQEESAVQNIFQYIVETPANYLKYYWGYLNFLDLKTSCAKVLGKDFDLQEFHRRVLEIGPVPFPVLEKYIRLEYADNNRKNSGSKKEALNQSASLRLISLIPDSPSRKS
ncbi:MAG: DUF885 domain-containing protein [Eubacteriales bacterium]|nr:DUF885 domain-containing protein [Eubacteriales bacterium]